jgi:uncharacterized membrane protein YphA (DoxX/SURF4 family)
LSHQIKNKMTRDKIIYWAATGLVAAGMGMSAFMYLSNNPELMNNFQALGLPAYFVMVLGVAKLLGAVALVAPVWARLKEWAYAGFTFTFLGAVWTHIATGTPWVAPLIALLILTVSYAFWLRVKDLSEKSYSRRPRAEVQVS